MKLGKFAVFAGMGVAACLFSACSSDDNNANGGTKAELNPGVATDKLLSALTDAEVTKLNQAAVDYLAKSIANNITTAQLCQYSGVLEAVISEALGSSPVDGSDADTSGGSASSSTDPQTICTEFVDQCNKSAAQESSTSMSASAAQAPATYAKVTTASLSGCSATVGEYSSCMTELSALYVSMMKNVPTCDKADAADLEKMVAPFATNPPASCQSLETKCPNALPGLNATNTAGA
jgi:hypothetical protein